jgi:hypothetical protein
MEKFIMRYGKRPDPLISRAEHVGNVSVASLGSKWTSSVTISARRGRPASLGWEWEPLLP